MNLPGPWRWLTGLATALVAAGVGACSVGSEPEAGARAGLDCVDDSPRCLDERNVALQAIMQDKDRTWVREPATPASYASGVRLFAFRQRKKELTCEELAIGRREAESAGGTLRGPGGSGLTPAQISRGAMLGSEVAKELGAEMGRRCRA
jgi:hypothetical protein